jgi:hypothetical protein
VKIIGLAIHHGKNEHSLLNPNMKTTNSRKRLHQKNKSRQLAAFECMSDTLKLNETLANCC